MTQDKQTFRRQRIFTTLDEMKTCNENISAQKLAARVNMGKQTVLPIYREWLELESLTEAEKVEIPEHLELAIKRELAKEKFSLREAQRNLQEALNESNEGLTETNKAFKECKHKNEIQETELKNRIKELDQQVLSTNEQLTENKTKLQTQQQTLDLLSNQLEKTEKQQQSVLKEQETRLDNAHRQIIDYWINIVDTERKEKEQLRKHNEQSTKTLEDKQKIILSLQQNEAHLQTDLIRTSAQLNNAEKENTALHKHKASFDKIAVLLGNPSDLYKHIYQLKNENERLSKIEQTSKDRLNKAETKLQAAKKINDEKIKLQHENIKLSAYIEGIQSKN